MKINVFQNVLTAISQKIESVWLVHPIVPLVLMKKIVYYVKIHLSLKILNVNVKTNFSKKDNNVSLVLKIVNLAKIKFVCPVILIYF